MCPHEWLRASDFSLGAARASAAAELPADLPLTLEAYERCVLERTLAQTRGDATGAARQLGIGRSTLYRKLAKHGLSPGRSARDDATAAGDVASIR